MASSSSSSSSRIWRYNVFTSFHGPDFPKTFLSHLRKQFSNNGISMFDDQGIERSQVIAPAFTQGIRDSKISILVLSKNYASSSWCLDELVEILKCKEDIGQIVMTVFYGVDPSDVRKQTGDFGFIFNETCSRKTKEERQRWSQALSDAGNIAGEHFLNWDNEADMIEKIAKDVLDKLNITLCRDFDGMVGLEAHLKEMMSRLDLDDHEVKVVAISGPAGIGKTTIARALLNLLSDRFQRTCFVDNLRRSYPSGSDEHGLKLGLQQQFLSNVLNHNDLRIRHLGAVKENLCDQKVFIILDDVNNLNQLEALANETTWFGPGSRIVVTTENQELLLQHGINNTYQVGFPSYVDAIEILHKYAFRQRCRPDGFEGLALRITNLCGNLPLALRVVGSSLRGKKEDEWEDVVNRLETILYREIEDVLRVGYESLDENEQTLFLHIAVFFNNKDGDYVKAMFADGNLDVKHGLKILAYRFLIKISTDGERIMMNKLLQQMAIQAIRKQEPRQILMDAKEICDVLENEMGTRDVSGILFDLSDVDEVCIREKALKRMRNLRFLKVYKSRDDGNYIMHIPEGMEFPRRLRVLDWRGYPSKCLPPTFHAECLVELSMEDSQLEYLWQGTQKLTNLKKMDLGGCIHLKELPDLSNATNLKKLDLSHCESLVEIPSSFSHLQKLQNLDMRSESDFIADIVLAVKKVITQIDERVSTNISHLGLGRDPRVFISFHGAELRKTFVFHLASALKRHGVNVYIDTDLRKGEALVHLFKRIEESKIALIIFSSSYTESQWCLNELVKIKELAEEGKLMAVPIFYKLNPSDVNGLEGDFGLNLWKNVKRNSQLENFKRWKEALDFVSQKHGMVCHENSDVMRFLESIVMHVKELISHSLEKFKKPHYGLRYQQKDALKDATSESFKGVEGILWDAKSDVKSEEAKLIEDDGLNLRVDENFLGQTNSDATSKLQKNVENDRVDSVSEEKKQEIISKSNTMVTYNERPSQHQVFINFWGADLRDGFVTHLKNALERDGVNVYYDVDEKMDDNLETRFKVMEESTIALVILSKMYTKSKWCLDELVKIIEQEEESKLFVIPIFYKVDPSQVEYLQGSFGDEFRSLCMTHRDHNINKWKEALDYVTRKRGFVLDKYSDEVNFVTDLSLEAKKVIVQISLKRIEKSQDQLSEQHKYATMDSSGLEGLKGMDGQREGILLDTKPDRNLKGADIVQAEEKSSRDDGLNLSKDDNFFGEANSENKRVDPVKEKASENSTMATYEKPRPQHQVFINFRGTDVRHSFVASLEKALMKDGVKVYNDKAEMGEDLGNLFEESRIALVIFSSRYAESTGCLNELVKIQELQEEGKLFVIPIFYKVDQSEVELLLGDFGVTFWNLWRIERDSHIIEWKEALKSVASMGGICSKDYISESEFITVTVRKVLEKISLHEEGSIEWPTRKEEKHETYRNKRFLFGMEQRMEKLEKKLEFDCKETRIIGVVGMHGIGKTTLAMMLHGKWNCKFIRCVPLLGIHKKSEDYGLAWLRKTLLEVLLEGKFPIISDEITHGTVQAELLKTKIFAVLDDVSDKKQLEFLLGDRGWLKKGSKIVITTCDKSLLEGYAHDTYVVPELDEREAFQLFSYLAFSDQTGSPTSTFLTLCRMVVDYARGNPLALNLLGTELHGKDKDQWKYKLETLTKKSNMMFQDVWRLSTDPLTENQKDVLLDIACFFKSEDEYIVRSLLDSGDPDSTNAVSEVKDLANKFLITVAHGRVEMNVPLYIYPMDLGSPRRLWLWNCQDIINKLMKMKKSDADNVRGIFINMSKLITNIYLDSSTFMNMRNLCYLKIYDYSCPGQCEVCKLCVLDGLELPLKEVRYLHWVRFPLEELPPDFSPENLVDLRLPYSKIKRVWEGGKKTPRLKWVDLSHSSKLLDLSALSNAENLQRLNLEGCTSLDELPMEIQSMKSLVFLNLRGCIRLWSLPKVKLIALKTLILSGCIILEEFHLFSESLEVLRLDDTAIKELPPGIKNLQRLVILNLKNCKMLNCLPNCLGELKALEELILSGCSRLKNLSDVRESMQHLQSLLLDRIGAKEMPNLSCVRISEGQASEDIVLSNFGPREWPRGLNGVCTLRRLCLSGNDFVSLQTDIGKLYNLNWLDVKQCKMLTSIPMLPPRLQYFDAHGCDSLQRVANPLALPVLSGQIHATFNFSNCNKLDQDAKDSIISYTQWKSQLVLDAIYQYNGGSVLDDYTGTCFPGREVPAWCSHQVSGSVLKSKLLPHWSDNRLTGIALCAVIILHGNFEQRNRLFLTCNCLFNNNDESLIHFGCTVGSWSKLSNTAGTIEPSHVFISYTSMLDIRKHSEQADEGGCSHTEASFEFQVTDGTKVIEDCEVLKCGFSFVYATDERENSRWYTENFVIPKRTDKIPGEERSYGNSGSHDGIQYESNSSLTLGREEKFFSEEKTDATPNLQKRGYLSDEDQAYWQHELHVGRPSSSMEMINPLTSSVDQLNERQKDVFLDIVYFFKSEDEYFVRSLLDSRNHEAVSEITDLANKFLITISQGRIEMHDQLYTLGKDHPSPRWQRLWNYKEIIDKLTEMEQQEANNVRGIFLDISEITTNIALECMAFTDMRNLLYLKIYDSSCPWQCTADYNLYLPDRLDFPLKEIRYLHWEKFPLEELPPDFRPENLVDLRLPYSKIERIWEGVKDTPWLKWVDLSHSGRLHDLSALSKAYNLQRLNLEGCTSLDKLPEEIHTMKSLVFLNLRGCVCLRSLPKMNLISLKTLILSNCSNLKEFQLISNNVEILHLDGTSIKGLPPAIRDLHRLVVLNLKNCKMLECLPDCLGSLEVLDELILSGCSRLNNLPDIRHSLKHLQILLLDGTGAIEMPSISCFTGFEGPNPVDMFLQPFESDSSMGDWPCGVNRVSSLRRLCLSGNDFVSLQPDIAELYNLKWLDVQQCKKLRFVPLLPPRLQYFDAHGCESLERVANPLALAVLSEQIHATFNFSNCNNLDQDAKDNIMSYTWWRSQLVLDELTRYNGGVALEALIGMCFPGWEVPAWFSHRASGSVVETKLHPHLCVNRSTGIALCAVIVFHGYLDQRKRVLVKCNCEFKNEDGSSIYFSCTVGGWSEPSNAPRKIKSTHVFIGYTSKLDINFHGEEGDKEGCSHTEAYFKFQVTDGTEVLQDCEVLKCGFSLLYETDELQAEPGVRGAPVEAKHYRPFSKNDVVISNVRGYNKTAERSPDGGCEIVELPNKIIAPELATTPQPPISKPPGSPEYGTGSKNLELERQIPASDVDALLSGESELRNASLNSVASSSSQAGFEQSHPQVFVSFHGAKLRKTVVRNLLSALKDRVVRAFKGKS